MISWSIAITKYRQRVMWLSIVIAEESPAWNPRDIASPLRKAALEIIVIADLTGSATSPGSKIAATTCVNCKRYIAGTERKALSFDELTTCES